MRSSSLPIINTSNISNINLKKAKKSPRKLIKVSRQAKIDPRKICQNLDQQNLFLKGNL